MSERSLCATPPPVLLEETVTVTQVMNGRVWLEGTRRSACGHCGVAGSCGSGALAAMLPERRVRLTMRNGFDARPGEQVVIGIDPRAIARGAALLYLKPAAAMVAAAMLASAAGIGDAVVAMASFAGLGAGLCLTNRFAARRGGEVAPVYLRHAGSCAPPVGGERTVRVGR